MTRTALFLSPHLDDVVFSCGGLAALLHDRGWHTVLATAFTATVLPATGFALACQTDKGLSPEIDYMALRRAEDHAAAAILGFSEIRHLGLPEAPHRGYHSAPALFGAVRNDDTIVPALSDLLADLQRALSPDIVLACQGLGNHVDHRQMVRAVNATIQAPLGWYRDTPYAMRHATAAPPHVSALTDLHVPIDATLERKLSAACAYASQVGFQFGGPGQAATELRNFAAAEADFDGLAERFAMSALAVQALSGGK